jgi:predicted secreted protein
MATHTGNEGTLKIGASTMAEIKSFTVTESADVAEDTAKGDDWRTFKTTFKSWSAEIEVHWDETDTTGQGACTIGAEVTVGLYFEGATAGDVAHTGSAIITERGIESPEDGIVPMKISLKGNGALVEAAVPA